MYNCLAIVIFLDFLKQVHTIIKFALLTVRPYFERLSRVQYTTQRILVEISVAFNLPLSAEHLIS